MKVGRRVDTPAAREFWRRVDESSREVGTWPAWRRAGINVSAERSSAKGCGR